MNNMEPKFTKGPWFYKHSVVGNETEVAAKIYGFDTAEKQANARLIAAAPEMYAFIKDTIEELRDIGVLNNLADYGESLLTKINS